jgi:hypothetical protein
MYVCDVEGPARGLQMKGFVKLYSVITIIHLTIIIFSLCVSTLGIVIKHPFIIYFWYLGLCGIAMMVVTSLLIGVAFMCVRIFVPLSSMQEQGLYLPSKGIHA